jgi:hypothetical protein
MYLFSNIIVELLNLQIIEIQTSTKKRSSRVVLLQNYCNFFSILLKLFYVIKKSTRGLREYGKQTRNT